MTFGWCRTDIIIIPSFQPATTNVTKDVLALKIDIVDNKTVMNVADDIFAKKLQPSIHDASRGFCRHFLIAMWQSMHTVICFKGQYAKTTAAGCKTFANYSKDEDYLIAGAFVHVTVDPIRDFGQKIQETPVIFQISNNTCHLTIHQNLFSNITSFVIGTYFIPLKFHFTTVTPSFLTI